jgi:hypothetical protein
MIVSRLKAKPCRSQGARHTSHEALGLPPTSIFRLKGLIPRRVMEGALSLEHRAQFC